MRLNRKAQLYGQLACLLPHAYRSVNSHAAVTADMTWDGTSSYAPVSHGAGRGGNETTANGSQSESGFGRGRRGGMSNPGRGRGRRGGMRFPGCGRGETPKMQLHNDLCQHSYYNARHAYGFEV